MLLSENKHHRLLFFILFFTFIFIFFATDAQAKKYTYKTSEEDVYYTSPSPSTDTKQSPSPSPSASVSPTASQSASSSPSSEPSESPSATGEPSGTLLLTYSYRRPFLNGKSKAVKKINNFFSNHKKSFMKDKDTLETFAKTAYASSSSKVTTSYKMEGVWTVKTLNSSILSANYVYTDFTGSNSMTLSLGVNFDIKSGKKVHLSEALNTSWSNTKSSIIKSYNSYVKKNTDYTFWSTNEITLKNFKEKQYQFFVSDSNVYITFSPGVLAPPAAGIITIPLKN